MAMAMVVSLAAPAAANAATALQAAHQTSKEVVSVLPMEVNEEVDLCFLGAPEGWRDLERGWTTSDEKIATVDNDGLIKAVAPGKATIKFNMEGCESAVVEVVVNAPVVAEEFEVTQKSGTALDINFAGETSYDVKDVTLYVVYENATDPENPIEIKWPIDAANSKKNGKVITITPFVALGDGDSYKVVVGNYEDTITTKIGQIDKITLTAEKNSVEIDKNVKVTPKLFSGDVDLTDRYINLVDVEYSVQILAGSKEDMKYDDDENFVLTVNFFEANMTVAVTAVVKNAKNETIATSDPVGITSVAKEPWSFEAVVVDWALIHKDAKKVDWNKKTVPADKSPEGEYSIVLKFKDSEGKTYVTAANAVQEDDDADAENIHINRKDDAITAAKYEVLFYSANEEVMLVDEVTGQIGVYTPETGVFYIGLNYFGADDEVLKYIYAGEVEIGDSTRLDKVTPKKATAEVVTAALTSDFVKDTTIELQPVDQYGDEWKGVSYTAYFKGANDAVVKIADKNFTGNKLTITGTDLKAANDAVEKVYIEATSTDVLNPVKVTTSVDVTIISPKYAADGKTIVLDMETKNRYKDYSVIVPAGETVDVYNTGSAIVEGAITLYQTSNGAEVGTYLSTDKIIAVKKAEELKGYTVEGTRYVVLRDSKGNVVALDWTTDDDSTEKREDNELVFDLNKITTSEDGVKYLTYAELGQYKIEVVTVRYNQRNGLRNDYVETAEFTVKTTAPEVKYAGKSSSTFGKSCVTLDSKGNVTDIDVEAVILATMKFKKGNDAYVPTNNIADYKAVVVGESVIIQYVVLEVPVASGAVVEVTIIPSSVVSVKYDANKQ
jgi:hypothetical protein